MFVSVAMATYNGERYLWQQLESLAMQARLPDELVVTDDQSTDATVALVERFSRQAPFPVHLEVNESRLGPTQNFGRALSLCRGDLILLCDQDDVWLPEKIRAHVELASTGGEAACWVLDALMADGELRPTGASKMQRIADAGLPVTAMVMGCCTAFRRDLLDLLLPIPATADAHDNWLVGVADLLGLVSRHGQAFQYYRRHGENVSNVPVNRIDDRGLGERLLAPMAGLLARAGNRTGIVREGSFLDLAEERLAERPTQVRGLVGDRADAAREAVARRAGAIRARIKARKLPRIQRVQRVIGLLRAGSYRDAGGLAGAAKDILLP